MSVISIRQATVHETVNVRQNIDRALVQAPPPHPAITSPETYRINSRTNEPMVISVSKNELVG